MKKMFVLACLLVVSVMAISTQVSAVENRPVQLSLFTPVQIFPEDYSITGVRFNLIYGRNVSVTGIDFGLINHTTSGTFTGIQWGLVGLSDSKFVGWQNNFANIVQGDFEGFQWGAVNFARNASGFQLGIVNYAQTLYGLQIGVVNIIKQDGAFPVFPIVNWSF